jgi:membrane-bound lytic murein transglycosylase A
LLTGTENHMAFFLVGTCVGRVLFRSLMVAQDTGSAIKGPVRGDFFWGFGEEALHWAGRMKQTGRYYLFLPKTVAARPRTAS